MLDTKKFIFLSATQRWVVTFTLLFTLFSLISLLIAAKLHWHDQDIKTLSIDLIKITVTALGAWGVILLYASANSFDRIHRETTNFLVNDVVRAFNTASIRGVNTSGDPINPNVKISIIYQDAQAAIYEFAMSAQSSIHFRCKLNVFDLDTLIYLPESHEKDYQRIYATSISYLVDGGTKVTSMGTFPSRWLPDNGPRFQLQIARKVGVDFLFDAASRTYFAGCIFSDLRAFLLRSQNEDQYKQKDPIA